MSPVLVNPYWGAAGGGGIPAGLVGQWLADTGVTLSSGNISAWADQSGNGNDLTTGSPSSSLVIVSSVINGFPVARTTGGTVKKTSPSNVPTGDFTIYAVTGGMSSGRQAIFTTASSGIAFCLGNGDASTTRIGGLYPGTAWVNSDTNYSQVSRPGAFDVVLAVRSGTTLTFYKNGATLGNTFTSTATGTTFSYGDDGSGSNGGTADCAEWGIYNTALGSTDRAALFATLGTKYAINIASTAGTLISRSGWTVSASRVGGGAAANAIDSNTATRWATGGAISIGSDFFEIDLGSAGTVGGFQINNASHTGDQPLAGNVQSSDDGTTWTTRASWSFTGNPSLPLLELSWTPSSHRWWRLLAEGLANGATSNWWSIDEINLYSDSAP